MKFLQLSLLALVFTVASINADIKVTNKTPLELEFIAEWAGVGKTNAKKPLKLKPNETGDVTGDRWDIKTKYIVKGKDKSGKPFVVEQSAQDSFNPQLVIETNENPVRVTHATTK